MRIQFNPNAVSVFIGILVAGVQMILPNHQLLGFVLIILAFLGLNLLGIKREWRSLNFIGVTPFIWIVGGIIILIVGALSVSRGVNLAWPPTTKEVKNDIPIIIKQLPTTGNIKKRTNDLTDKILWDLYINGFTIHNKILQPRENVSTFYY